MYIENLDILSENQHKYYLRTLTKMLYKIESAVLRVYHKILCEFLNF